MKNYVIIHCHSDFSNGVTNIDSVTKYDDYINKSKELGMKALAFSEHGNIFGWYHKKNYIEESGMKYIHAEEFYITKTLNEKIRDNYHCLLIARNYEGFLELNKLSSKAFNRKDGHFHYVPRISFDELINTSENIIISTACLGGILNCKDSLLKESFIYFLKKNNNRCFLEIQHHNVAEQIKYNKYLYELSKTINVPLVACTDTHALDNNHLKGRSILQKAKKIFFDNESGWDLSFKSYDELVKAYENQKSLPMNVVLEAIDNTNKIADMVEEFEISKEYKYPHLWENPLELFRKKIKKGIIEKKVDKYPNYQEYLDRVEYEIEAYIHNGAIDFMLLMEDIISWCKEHDIPIGYGRGSVNGSVIAWLLNITEMDSIKHNLNFERFMNVERVSLSDIDTDFPPSRINEVKDYIFSKHGLFCSDIITFNTIADKGAIRDVGRALEIPLDEVSKICESVDKEETYEKSKQQYKELFELVDIVKGTIVSIGSHPCGSIVSPQTLDDNIGLCTTSSSNYPISQIYMKEIDNMNYVKLDLLKLDTIEVIYNTCKLAGIEMLKPDNMDTSDINVWNSMRDDTTGIFQWEGVTGDKYIKKLLSDENIEKFKKVNDNVDRMTLLTIGNSAIRPAGASYREDLSNGVVRVTGSKPIDEFLKSTFGYLVFQCQIIEFLHKYCGFTMGEADIVRRGFAKKKGTKQYIPIIKNGGYLSDKSTHYIKGFIATMKEKYDIDKEKSEKDIIAFIQVIIDASSYLFSLNHSQPYSFAGYGCGWLRYYYPLEFITSELRICVGNEEKTKAFTEYAKKRNINIYPPKFRYSKSEYFFDKETNTIYKGIGSIKYMNSTVSDELYELKDNKYETFIDLLVDINKTTIDSRQLNILIKLNFFEEFGDVNMLLKQAEIFSTLYGKKQISINKAKELNISEFILIRNSKTITKCLYKDINTVGFIKDICEDIDYKAVTISELIKYQIEFLGYVDYVNPELDIRLIAVTKLDTTYSPRFTAICLKNGSNCEMKVNKTKNIKNKSIVTSFKDKPFEEGDIIYMKKCSMKPKQRKTDDGWEIVPNEFNWFIDDYDIRNEVVI